ncbi:unnamed protein product, partial [Mesorhabditis spiculigera]
MHDLSRKLWKREPLTASEEMAQEREEGSPRGALGYKKNRHVDGPEPQKPRKGGRDALVEGATGVAQRRTLSKLRVPWFYTVIRYIRSTFDSWRAPDPSLTKAATHCKLCREKDPVRIDKVTAIRHLKLPYAAAHARAKAYSSVQLSPISMESPRSPSSFNFEPMVEKEDIAEKQRLEYQETISLLRCSRGDKMG